MAFSSAIFEFSNCCTASLANGVVRMLLSLLFHSSVCVVVSYYILICITLEAWTSFNVFNCHLYNLLWDLFKSFAFFHFPPIGVAVFYCWDFRVLHIFCLYTSLFCIYDLKIFFPVCGLPFPTLTTTFQRKKQNKTRKPRNFDKDKFTIF